MLVDSHCHLASRRFQDEAEAVVTRAREHGVSRIIAIGTDLEDSAACIALAERFPDVYATVGVHPTSVPEIEEPRWLEKLEALAAHPKVVALGELGLDFFHKAPAGWQEQEYRSRQRDFLRQQLDLAVRLGFNVVVHTRESLPETAETVAPYAGKLRAVFHCYVDAWESAAPLIDAGHLISFTGIATFKSAETVHDTVTRVPAGHFMIETDAPYLAPVPHRGKPNEPGYVRFTAEAIAQRRREPLTVLAEHTTHTAETFFRLP